MKFFYQYWSRGCLPLSIYMTVVLLSFLPHTQWIVFLIWIQFPIYAVHQFEEHALHDAFKKFINLHVFQSKQENSPLTDKDVFWINIPIIGIGYPLMAVLAQNVSIKFGVILIFFSLFNATTHIIMAGAKRCYNPGVLTAIFLIYPVSIYTLYYMIQHHLLSWEIDTVSLVIAFLFHLGMITFAVTKYKRAKRDTQ